MKLVFATHNAHKLREVQQLLPAEIELLSLEDIGCMEEIPETGETLEENAKIKADYVTQTYGFNCFSDDTGLLIDALNGEPGVYSARYAGLGKDANANMDKVLSKLQNENDRNGHFKTVIHLNLNDESFVFSGIVEGSILKEKKGQSGFGYDPIFQPQGYSKSFGEMTATEKNSVSHRARAMQKLVSFFKNRQL